MFPRLFFICLFVVALQGQTHKVWFNTQDSLVYFFEQNHIVTKNLSGKTMDSLTLNPIPEQYPAYTPAWFDGALHLAADFGGLVYRINADTTRRIDHSFAHKKQSQATQFVRNDTLFRYGGYGFWRANNFFTFFDPTTKEWQYYPTSGNSLPPEVYDGPTQLIDNDFYVLGGTSVNPHTGFQGSQNKDLWLFDFSKRRWRNLGTAGADTHKSTPTQKGNQIVFFGSLLKNSSAALLDFKNNRIQYYQKDLIGSVVGEANHPFFVGDTLYYIKDDRLHQAVFGKDFFVKPTRSERLYFDANSLFTYLSYFFLVVVVVIVCVFVIINYRKRQAPTLVRGGIRCQGTFYALRPDEEAIVRLLYAQKKETNDVLLAQIANAQLSYSQNSKRKTDAIQAVNALMTQLAGKPLIVARKASQDKRQTIYHLTPNILQ